MSSLPSRPDDAPRPGGREVGTPGRAVPRSARHSSPGEEPTQQLPASQRPDTSDPDEDTEPDTPVAGRNLPVAIVVGVVLGALFIVSIFTSPLAFTVVVAGFVLVGAIEATAELRRVGLPSAAPVVITSGMVTVFGAYRSQHAGQVAGMLVLFLGAVGWLLADPRRRDVVHNLAMTVMLGIWLGLLGSFAVLLAVRPEDGPVAVLAVIGAAVFGDIGGYAVGVAVGRTKIAPTVSPNKSLEGLVGGLVVATGLAALVLPRVGTLFTPATAAAVAAVCVLAGFVGDLTESMVKRDLGIKDFGSLLPGHGGVLDRLDGVLVALPVGFFAIVLLT